LGDSNETLKDLIKSKTITGPKEEKNLDDELSEPIFIG